MSTPDDATPGAREDFQRAADGSSTGLLVELARFLRENRKWWLVPVIVSLIVIGALVLLGGTAVAPFIYTLW